MIRSLAAWVAAGLLASPMAAAQDKVIRLVVAFPPGGPVDFVARVIADPLGRELNQRVIVENKPGGNGAVAAQSVAQAAADGTALWLTSVGAAAVNPVLYEKLPYDMQRDFAAVSLVVDNDELLVVNPANPARDAAEFVDNARKSSQPVAIASSGVGSIPHLAMEQLADASRANLLHVPYKGAAPAITDVMGGQVCLLRRCAWPDRSRPIGQAQGDWHRRRQAPSAAAGGSYAGGAGLAGSRHEQLVRAVR